jgi:hypothetical protein
MTLTLTQPAAAAAAVRWTMVVLVFAAWMSWLMR